MAVRGRPIADLRKSYELGSLEEADLPSQPLQQFERWFDEAVARGEPEPNAMTLATVDASGRPSTRVVLVKDFNELGLVWFTNYNSRKGRDLAARPHAALQFHWVSLERVVRIEGRVEPVSAEESDAYYETRPLAHRIGAWASEQSEVIPNRGVLVTKAAEYGLTYGVRPPRPPHWGGYRLQPDYWEFWQGRKSRLHDRIAYRRQHDSSWVKERLSP